jgi:class 3 adenylate cyclase
MPRRRNMNRSSEKPVYPHKFYNVKIMRAYIAYLKEKCLWSEERIEHLIDLSGFDITFLDSEDNWFDQRLADRFQMNVQKMTSDKEIAYKVGAYSFSSYARGISGRLIQGFATPQMIFKNIAKHSMAYSRGALLTVVSSTATTATLRCAPVEGCDEKPYQCLNRKGTLEAVPPFFGCKGSQIVENRCVHQGDPCCEYLLEWKSLTPFPSFLVITGSGFSGLIAALLITENLLFSIVLGMGLGLLAGFLLLRKTVTLQKELISEKDNALQESIRIFHRRYEEDVLKQNIVLKAFQSLSLNELCGNTANAVKDGMKFDRVLIMLKDSERNVLKTTAAVGFEGNLREIVDMAEFSIDPGNTSGFFVNVYNTGKPLFLRDVQKKMNQLSPRSRQLLKLLGTKAFIVVPITTSGNSVGIMAVENLDETRPLINDDVTILNDIANLMGLVIPKVKNFIAIQKSERLFRALEDQERQLRKIFQKFIPGEAVYRLRHYGSEFLNVQKRTLDVMFVDIMGFTSFSETMPPEEVADILNIYIDEVQEAVNRYDGRINKIIGDGLLIYFDNIGPNSIHAGYAILQACGAINRRLRAKGYTPIAIGVGAHRGDCTIGYIGTKERLDYTLIGDTVNVAARLEGYTRKIGPNSFCFSSALIDAAIDFDYISQGKVPLKGRKKFVEVLQLLKPLKNKKMSPLLSKLNRATEDKSKLEFAGKIKENSQESHVSASWSN